jgi:hypothetical protein
VDDHFFSPQLSMNRKSFIVTVCSKRWVVKDRKGKTIYTAEMQSAAESHAIALAKQNRPSQVTIHNKKGEVQNNWTYWDL